MPEQNWKRLERKALRYFNATRVASSGGTHMARDKAGHVTTSDSNSITLYIEVKSRKEFAAIEWYLDTVRRMEASQEHGKVPLMVFVQTGHNGNRPNPVLVLCAIEDLGRIYDEWDDAHELEIDPRNPEAVLGRRLRKEQLQAQKDLEADGED